MHKCNGCIWGTDLGHKIKCLFPRCIYVNQDKVNEEMDMALRALRPCKHSGCVELTRDATGYCKGHIGDTDQARKDRYRQTDKHRGTARERGYTTRWEQSRRAYLKQNPLCVECLKDNKYIPATVVDHIIPHRGDQALFWDVNNWQSLCNRHHGQKTARGE